MGAGAESGARSAIARAWSTVLGHGTGRWIVLAGLVGMASGLVGSIFNLAVNLLTHLALGLGVGWEPLLHGARLPPAPPGEPRWWLVVPVVALGCGLAGWLASFLAAEAAGGGTGTAVEAFHQRRGLIPLRLTLTKLAASVLTLGSGGSGGREGPIALVGAGAGSWTAQRLGLTVRDRRTLLVAGIAGGVAAVFHAPLAAAIFAVEVLYRGPDLEAEALIPAAIAAVLAFITAGLADGAWNVLWGFEEALTGTLFRVSSGLAFHAGDWRQLLGYLAVAVMAAAAARAFMAAQAAASPIASRLVARIWLRAALGGALTGALALAAVGALRMIEGGPDARIALTVLGPGYGLVQQVFDADPGLPWAAALFLLALAKILATACTVGSGGSGGLFAPSLVVGGAVGAATAISLRVLAIPAFAPAPAAGALMGMGAVLAATHRTPVAAILMVCELAGTYALLIPAMWCTGLAMLLTGQRSLFGSQVQAAIDSPAHRGEMLHDPFSGARVAELLSPGETVACLAPGDGMATCRILVEDSRQTVFPVLDPERRLLGLVTIDDLRGLLGHPEMDALVRMADLMAGKASALGPGDSLARALRRFAQVDLDDLPVVDGQGRFLGLLSRESLFRFYRDHAERLAAERRDEGDAGTGAWRRTTMLRVPPPE